MGTTKYTYAHGLLATEDGPWANDTVAWDRNTARKRSALRLQQTASHCWTNSYAHDNNGNRTSRTAGGSRVIWMVYDDKNQLIRQETDTYWLAFGESVSVGDKAHMEWLEKLLDEVKNFHRLLPTAPVLI